MSSADLDVFRLVPPWDHISELVALDVIDLSIPRARMLDLGCGSMSKPWLGLLAVSDFGRYVGVDNKLEERDHYEDFIRFRQEGYLEAAPKLDRAQFDKRIQVHRQTAEAFLQNTEDCFDIVVLSDFLHLNGVKDHWSALLAKSMSKLGRGGYGYVKVITTASPDWTYQTPFEAEEVEALFGMMNVVYTCQAPGDLRKMVFVLSRN